jgi:RNA-directed DNA polymerase
METSSNQETDEWLKTGIMEGLDFSSTEAGTPQGGVISPLLMNVALHGMETAVKRKVQIGQFIPTWTGKIALVQVLFIVFSPYRCFLYD